MASLTVQTYKDSKQVDMVKLFTFSEWIEQHRAHYVHGLRTHTVAVALLHHLICIAQHFICFATAMRP